MAALVSMYIFGYVLSLAFVIGPYFINEASSQCDPDISDYAICTFFALFFSLVWFVVIPFVLIGALVKFLVEDYNRRIR